MIYSSILNEDKKLPLIVQICVYKAILFSFENYQVQN